MRVHAKLVAAAILVAMSTGCASMRFQDDFDPLDSTWAPPILGMPTPEELHAAVGGVSVSDADGELLVLSDSPRKGELRTTIGSGRSKIQLYCVAKPPDGSATQGSPYSTTRLYLGLASLANNSSQRLTGLEDGFKILRIRDGVDRFCFGKLLSEASECASLSRFSQAHQYREFMDLILALDHPNILVKRLAAHTIGTLWWQDRGSKGARQLAEYAEHDDELLRFIVAHARARLADTPDCASLRQGLASDDAAVRCYTCYAIGVWGTRCRDLMGPVEAALSDPNPYVRAGAANTLSWICGEPITNIDFLISESGAVTIVPEPTQEQVRVALLINAAADEVENQEAIVYPYFVGASPSSVASIMRDALDRLGLSERQSLVRMSASQPQ